MHSECKHEMLMQIMITLKKGKVSQARMFGVKKKVSTPLYWTHGQNSSQIFAVATSPEFDLMRTRQAFCGKQPQHKPCIWKGQKCSGGKNSKKRVTVLVACNQDGTDKLPLVVIRKYAKPWCFRGSNMGLIPVAYKSQKNPWIDSVSFEEWVKKWSEGESSKPAYPAVHP